MANFTPMVTAIRPNGTRFAFPEPSTYDANTSTIVDSARNTSGYFVGAVIREDVAKATMSWKFLSVEQWKNILSVFSSKKGGRFYSSFVLFLQDEGGWVTRKMYVSDRNASVFIRNPDGSIKGYQNPKLSLIEV